MIQSNSVEMPKENVYADVGLVQNGLVVKTQIVLMQSACICVRHEDVKEY